MSAFDGIRPTLTHVPPSAPRSRIGTPRFIGRFGVDLGLHASQVVGAPLFGLGRLRLG